MEMPTKLDLSSESKFGIRFFFTRNMTLNFKVGVVKVILMLSYSQILTECLNFSEN